MFKDFGTKPIQDFVLIGGIDTITRKLILRTENSGLLNTRIQIIGESDYLDAPVTETRGEITLDLLPSFTESDGVDFSIKLLITDDTIYENAPGIYEVTYYLSTFSTDPLNSVAEGAYQINKSLNEVDDAIVINNMGLMAQEDNIEITETDEPFMSGTIDIIENDYFIGDDNETLIATDIPVLTIVDSVVYHYDSDLNETIISGALDLSKGSFIDGNVNIPTIDWALDKTKFSLTTGEKLKIQIRYKLTTQQNGQTLVSDATAQIIIIGVNSGNTLNNDAVVFSNNLTQSGNVFSNDIIDGEKKIAKWVVGGQEKAGDSLIDFGVGTFNLKVNGDYTITKVSPDSILPNIEYFDTEGNSASITFVNWDWAVWTEAIPPEDTILNLFPRNRQPSRPINATGGNREDIYQLGTDDQTIGKYTYSGNSGSYDSGQSIPICKFHRGVNNDRPGQLSRKNQGDIIEAQDVNTLKELLEIQVQLFVQTGKIQEPSENLIKIEKDQIIFDWNDKTLPEHRRKITSSVGHPVIKPDEWRKLFRTLSKFVDFIDSQTDSHMYYIDREMKQKINDFELQETDYSGGTNDMDNPDVTFENYKPVQGKLITVGFYNSLINAYNLLLTSCVCNTDCACNSVCVCNVNCGCHYSSDQRLKNVFEPFQNIETSDRAVEAFDIATEIVNLLKPKVWQYNDYGVAVGEPKGITKFGPMAQDILKAQTLATKLDDCFSNTSLVFETTSKVPSKDGGLLNLPHYTIDAVQVQEFREYFKIKRDEFRHLYDDLKQKEKVQQLSPKPISSHTDITIQRGKEIFKGDGKGGLYKVEQEEYEDNSEALNLAQKLIG